MGKSSSSSSRPGMLQCSSMMLRWMPRSAKCAAAMTTAAARQNAARMLSIHGSETTGNQTTMGKKCEVFEHRHGQIGLFSCRLAGEGDDLDVEEEEVGEQQAHAGGDEQLACCCRPGEKFRRGEGAEGEAGAEGDDRRPREAPRVLAACNCCMAVLRCGGLPWTMRKTQLPC